MSSTNPCSVTSSAAAASTGPAPVSSTSPAAHSSARHLRARMLRVFGAHSLGNLVTLADRFLLLPVMLLVWGPKITGVWLTIRSLPAVLSVGEMGFASATGNRMTELVASHDFSKAARVYWVTSRLINTVSMISLAVVVLVVMTLPLSSWFKGQVLEAWEFNWAVFLMAVYTVSIFQTQLYYAGYRSIHLQATAAFGTHLMRIAELGFVVAALCLHLSVIAVAAAYVTARLIGAYWLRRTLLRKADWLDQHRATSWSEARPLLHPALGFAALPLAQTLQLQGSTLAVAAVTSPELVAAFNAMRTLARFPIQFCSTLGRTVWPELSQALARHENDKVLRLNHRMMWLSLAFALGSIAGLLGLGSWVYGLWTSSRLEYSTTTFALLSIAAGVTAYSTNAMSVLNAMSAHGRTSAVWVTMALVTVAITMLIPGWLGMVGIAWVLLAGDLLVLAYVLYSTHLQLQQLRNTPLEHEVL